MYEFDVFPRVRYLMLCVRCCCGCVCVCVCCVFLFQAEDGIRYLVRSRGLGDVYKRQILSFIDLPSDDKTGIVLKLFLFDSILLIPFPSCVPTQTILELSLIHI